LLRVPTDAAVLCGDDVLRIFVTGGPPVRSGGGIPHRIIASSVPESMLRTTGAGGNTPIGARLPTYLLTTRNSAIMAAWLVVMRLYIYDGSLGLNILRTSLGPLHQNRKARSSLIIRQHYQTVPPGPNTPVPPVTITVMMVLQLMLSVMASVHTAI
jgi:hypothetical protein